MQLAARLKLTRNKPITPLQISSTNWIDRSRILDDHVNLYVWERKLPNDMINYLQKLLNSSLTDISCLVTNNELQASLDKLRQLWDQEGMAEGDSFWDDVMLVTRDFLNLSDTRIARLHLRTIDNNACNKFHVDGYHLRLFSTYLGPGTEWLPEEAVHRTSLGSANEQIVAIPSKVQRMSSGHVGILKGEIPNRFNPVGGIVHRSPELSGQKRIILRVDI